MKALSLALLFLVSTGLHAVNCDDFARVELSDRIPQMAELREKVQAMVNRLRAQTGQAVLPVHLEDSELVKVQVSTDELTIHMGLFQFVQNDRDLAEILKFEMNNVELVSKNIAERYKGLLPGRIELKPSLEYVNPGISSAMSSMTVMSVARAIMNSVAYQQHTISKFDYLMNVDLADARAVVAPLYTGSSLPAPNYAYFMHNQFEKYYRTFKLLYPFEKVPAPILRRLEVRLQSLIRKQMNRMVEEIIHARLQLNKPLTKEENLIVHHMTTRFWSLMTTESTPMMRLGNSPWLVLWTIELHEGHKEMMELHSQAQTASTDHRRSILDKQMTELQERQSFLRARIESMRSFYNLETNDHRILAWLERDPSRFAPGIMRIDQIFTEKLKGAGPYLTRAGQLQVYVDKIFAKDSLADDLRATPDRAFWLLRSVDKQPIDVQIDANKKAHAILIELKSYDSLRTLVRSDHDWFTVGWYRENPHEARAYSIRALEAINQDPNFDANKKDHLRGSFVAEFVKAAKWMNKVIANVPAGLELVNPTEYVLTSEMRLTLGRLAFTSAKRSLEAMKATQTELIGNNSLSAKDRDQKLMGLFGSETPINSFYNSIFADLELGQKPHDGIRELVLKADALALNVYTEMFKVAGVPDADAGEVARVFLAMNTRHFGRMSSTLAPDVDTLQRAVRALNQLSFIRNGHFGFARTGNLVNQYKSNTRAELLAATVAVADHIESKYLEELPEGMSANRYFDTKYQMAVHLLKFPQPNFKAVGEIMSDSGAGSEQAEIEKQRLMSRPLQLKILKQQFELGWKRNASLESSARIRQALIDFSSGGDRLLSEYGAKEGVLALAQEFMPADRALFIREVIAYIKSGTFLRYNSGLIESLDMALKLGL